MAAGQGFVMAAGMPWMAVMAVMWSWAMLTQI